MFSEDYLKELCDIISRLDILQLERMVQIISQARLDKGRIFFLGLGGSSANCSHAVNDFRKICGIECYAPTDNVSELTARTNDEGFESIFVTWLATSHLNEKDVIYVMSVGGGSMEKSISLPLVFAMGYAKDIGCKIIGVVSRDGGYLAEVADAKIIVPIIDASRTTPHAEELASVITHLLVSHPMLQVSKTKWETV